MKIPALFKEYIWLVNVIRRARRISLTEINEKWVATDMSGGVPFARTTFNRHKDAIQDIFGIFIDCDRKNGYKYFVGNEHVLREESVQNWMLTTLSVHNLISESLSLQDRILLEHIPSNGDLLRIVIHAMKANQMLSVHYRRYQSAESKTYVVAPYCIKLFHRRWYILARYPNGNFGILSFDRIEQMELTEEKFEIDSTFDASTFFSDSFGVMISNDMAPERIVLRAYGTEACYLRDLPLHASQIEMGSTDDYADFEVCMKPTNDLKAHLLSRGQWLQVLSPPSLADDIRRWHQEAIDRYDAAKIDGK